MNEQRLHSNDGNVKMKNCKMKNEKGMKKDYAKKDMKKDAKGMKKK